MAENKSRVFTVLKILAPMLIVAFIFIANIVERIIKHEAGVTAIFDEDYTEMIVKDIANTNDTIVCSMYMYKLDYINQGDFGEAVPLITEAFIDAVKRGVNVAILFEKKHEEDHFINEMNEKTAKYLVENGVKVFFDNETTDLNAKMCILDNEVIYVGSHNLTFNSLNHHSEVSMRMKSPELAANMQAYINSKIVAE